MAKRTCSIEGCDRPSRSRGWCVMHYARWHQYGTTDLTHPERKLPILDRFLARIKVDPATGCWIWRAERDANGYGKFFINGTKELAHRVSWVLFVGSIKDGLFVLHRCDNPPCVRPDHLFLGTQADNVRDMARKGRTSQQQRTHCPRGHEYTEANTYVARTGGRICRACRRMHQRRYEASRLARLRDERSR